MKNIKLIVYDFDGVMTNNKVYMDQNGNEMVQVNRADGLGVAEIKKLGIEQMIISTETNPVVSTRAKKLGINCLQGIDNKKDALKDYCFENQIELTNVIYIGNDINDLECMNSVGFPIAVADAFEEIKEVSIYTLTRNGGDGAVREFCDLIYQSYKNGE